MLRRTFIGTILATIVPFAGQRRQSEFGKLVAGQHFLYERTECVKKLQSVPDEGRGWVSSNCETLAGVRFSLTDDTIVEV